ncbi:MAG: HD domain-containing protein [Candidatus Magasanikbacteria bacterium]
MNQKIQTLIHIGQEKMAASRDTMHDIDHVKRVVQYSERFASEYDLSEKEKQALILAAWWHDVSRTFGQGNGTYLMFFSLIDDLVSAAMLWWKTVQFGMFGTAAGLAIRIILCKTIGTGAVFTKLLLRKKHRLLVNILKDADNIDLVHINRVERLLRLAELSRMNQQVYRIMIRWHVRVSHLTMRTRVAREYIVEVIKQLIEWMKNTNVYLWHIQRFGKQWIDENMERVRHLYKDLCSIGGLKPVANLI